MRMLKSTLIGIGGSALLVLAGCSASVSQHPPTSQLKEGLNLLDIKDPTFGMSAAYVKQGRVLYFETRVGQLKPEIYRMDTPNEPQYEMDMRFVDAENHTIYAVRGGDNFADPTWAADIVASRHLPPAAYANRALDFQLAKEASAATQGEIGRAHV